MSTKLLGFDVSREILQTKMSFIVTRYGPRLLKPLKVSHNFKQLSSFVKDEFSGMKYWEQDYASRKKNTEDKESLEESISYEDLYKNSYNAFVSKTSLAQDESTSMAVTGQDDATSPNDNLTHVDVTGRANMVDVGDKKVAILVLYSNSKLRSKDLLKHCTDEILAIIEISNSIVLEQDQLNNNLRSFITPRIYSLKPGQFSLSSLDYY